MRLRRQFGTATALTLAAAMLAASAASANAQVRNCGARQIVLQQPLAQSLTLTVSGNAVNFTLVAGSANNAGSTSITATTTWSLNPGRTMSVYAFFGNSSSALADGAGDNIPSTDFQISDNGGAFNALTHTVPFGGASAGLLLSSTAITGANKNSSRNDVMLFKINLSPLPNLPAGAYTGTLTIQAQAI
jgi:hypothetical protein